MTPLEPIRPPAACDEPKTMGSALERVIARVEAMPDHTDPRMPDDMREKFKARDAQLDRFFRDRGKRYEACRLANFDTSVDNGLLAKAAVNLLHTYCENIRPHIELGEGLLLFGPPGTGKDHLLSAVCRVAIMSGCQSVRWHNGMEVFAKFRDAISSDTQERDVTRELTAPTVLYLSDPLPPVGALSEWQAQILFRVLDRRYSSRKPTYVSVNVADRDELESRAGPQNAERMRDGALAVFCNWPSYRRALVPKT